MPQRNTPFVADGLLHQPTSPERAPIAVGSPAWYAWLDEATTRSFAFHASPAHFTARKERRQRGGSYWSAYRNVRGKTASVYLGTPAMLTLERLQAAAARLAAPARPEALPNAKASAPELPLLQLSRPHPRPDLVSRPRLLAQLAAGARFPISLIIAPAGFGKTTLLAQGLEAWGSEPASRAMAQAASATPPASRVAWLTADASVDAPNRLLRAIIGALRTIAPDTGDATLALLREPQTARLELLVASLAGELSACPPGSLLILDDYHALTNSEVHRATALLVEQLPPSLRLVVAAREEPPLPLPRWRARGLLAELHAADLRFAPAEAAAFLRHTMSLALSDGDAAALTARTEGWAAGLQLAALALREQPDPAGLIATFAGDNRLVVDYLSSEVIAALPAHLQEFLLQTSILDQLCGPLCDAVLGVGDQVLGIEEAAKSSNAHHPIPNTQAYSQLVLEELERRNLFLMPLDLTRSWYRYHQLFRDVLQRRLAQGAAPQLQAELHRRAAGWFAAQLALDLVTPALQHALAAGDDDTAATLLLRHAPALLRRLDLALVHEWLALLPSSLVRRHARLALIAGWTLTLTGRLGAAIELLDQASATREPQAPPAVVAEARLIGAMNARLRGDLPAARRLVAQALPDVDPADLDASTWAAYLHGFTMLDDDDQESARAALEQAVELGAAAGQLPLALSALSRLALNALRRGQLTAAQSCCGRADALVAGMTPPPAAGLADIVRGVVAYRRDDLVGAQRAVLRGIERLRGWIDHHMLVLGMLYQARCLQALGQPEAGHAALDRAGDWLHQRRIGGPSQALLAAERARLWLRQGRLDDAAQSLQAGLSAVPQPGPQQLTLARLWIAQARADGEPTRLHEAAAILRPLREIALARGWEGDLNEIELLEALALAGLGQTSAAVERLVGVLARAEPEGALRPIADEGALVAPLLRQIAVSHRALRRTARRLLDIMEAADPALEPASVDELTTLTARELEVLRLLAAGGSTLTIAAQLVVSPGTAKRHIGNILRKLAVHSRLEAVTQARALGLI